MDAYRADIDALAAVNALVAGVHHLELAAESFRVGAPGAADVAAFEKIRVRIPLPS
ncbi:hypothetical protein GGER_04770 [Serratia rubidaea]